MVIALCLSVSAARSLPAQQPAEQRPPITFRSEINYVEIDAIVTDSAGRFVTGLKAEDFQVLEEGRPQQIAGFSMVRVPVEPSPAPSIPALHTPEPDAFSNEVTFNGRLFLLLLDDLHTDLSRTRFVRKAAREFIERHVAPNDLVAITLTSGRSTGQDFTSSRARLLAAIERFTGSKLQSPTAAMIETKSMEWYILETETPSSRELRDPYKSEREVRTLGALRTLELMSEFLGGIRGRRKALLYFGEGSPVESTEIVDARQRAIAAATRANVSVYTLDPRGLSTGLDDAILQPTMMVDQTSKTLNPTSKLNPNTLVAELSTSHAGMRSVSEETGGIAFLNTSDTTNALARVLEDSSNYYILGYYAPAGRSDGRYRAVDVRVTRPGLTVRARRGYYAPGQKPRSSTTTETAASSELQAAIRSPLPTSGLVFNAAATAFQGKGAEASVALVVEVDPAHLSFDQGASTRNTDIELHVSASDQGAKTDHRTYHLAKLRLRPETYENVTKEGVRILRRLDLKPGSYRLQIGVRDKTGGAVGTAFTDVDIPDFSKPRLGLSGLAVVSAAATRIPTVEPDPILAPLLPGAHTARRMFPVNDTLAVFAEVYENDVTESRRVQATTSILAEDGRVVYRAVEERGNEEMPPTGKGGASTARAWGHTVTIPVSELGTGQFLLRVQVAHLLPGAEPVTRELAFTVR